MSEIMEKDENADQVVLSIYRVYKFFSENLRRNNVMLLQILEFFFFFLVNLGCYFGYTDCR